VALVSNTASPATLAAAAARRCGLQVVDEVRLDDAAGPLDFQEALTLVLGRSTVDAAAVLYAPLYHRDLDNVAEAVATAAARAGRTVVASYLGRRQPPPGPVPAYRFPEEGVRALALAARYASWRAQHLVATAPEQQAPAVAGAAGGAEAGLARATELVARVLAERPEGAVLDGEDGARLLSAVGAVVADQRWVESLDEAVAAADELGWPVALKAGTRPPVARTEATGLALDLDGPDELIAAWGRMSAALGAEALRRALVQRMAPPGIDARVLALADPHLGPVVALGRGGVAGSRPEELAVRLAPLDPGDAGRLVDASPLPIEALPPLGRRALEELSDRVGRLVADLPEVAEVRLDPVLVSERAAVVTDLVVRVAPAPAASLPAVRRVG
jgi:acyl-CoA synthetase (NDP forming)